MKRIRNFSEQATRFVTHDLWMLPLDRMPRAKSFLYRNLRILVIAGRGFKENDCRMRASALTYYSLMAIVPVLALAFAIAKGFGHDHWLQTFIMNNFSGHDEIVAIILDFANRLIAEARGGLIAGIGLIVLIWAVVEVFSHIEHSFNEIWEQKKGRSLARKFSDYLSMIIVAPLLLLLAGSSTAFITSWIMDSTHENGFMMYAGPVLLAMMKFLPVVMIWILFTVIYMVMPNTRVRFIPALIGGLIAGTLYQLIQIGYFVVQIELIDLNAVYGSFAALPLLFLWLRASWIILLLGAELSYAYQNVKKFEYEMESTSVSNRVRRIVQLMVASVVVKNFVSGEKPPTENLLATGLRLPLKLVRQVCWELVSAGVLSEVRTENDREFAYVPSTDTSRMDIQFVTDRIEKSGPGLPHLEGHEQYEAVGQYLEIFSRTLNAHPSNKLLADL
jgi:membrane protein